MSLFDYNASKVIALADYPFYALIMAAMRQADTVNSVKLLRAFPQVHAELAIRYNAPGGYLPGELVPAELEKALDEVKAFTIEED